MTASDNKPHILIAGAGIGGLVLAQCLRAKNHPYTIFDRDVSAHARPQGWAIALHTILDDLMASVPKDMPSIEMTNHLLPLEHLSAQLCFFDARNADEPLKRFMVESKSYEEVGYGEGRVIRANRDRLRDWLLSNIDVQWGKQLVGFSQNDDSVTVNFADGSTATGAFLVGADGVKSVVRDGLIPGANLNKVPECFLTGEVTLQKEQYERQMKLAHSSYAVIGPGYHTFIGLSKVADDASSADYVWMLIWSDEARAAAAPHWIDSASPEELYDFAVQKTSSLNPMLREIIDLAEPRNVKTPPLVLRDLVLGDMPVSRVTLLGDAAHAMTPFRGEGGCHAMNDAMKLAAALTSGGSLDEYQKEMLSRTESAVKASRMAANQAGNVKTTTRVAWGQNMRPAPMTA